MLLHVQCDPQPLQLPPLTQPQVAYVHLVISTQGDRTLPLHLVVVADASRSMRIPIVDEHRFRELVRNGGAHEVLVDGVPVWQLANPLSSEARSQFSSPIDYTVRALHSVVERLTPDDRMALIACASDALVLAPSTPGHRRTDLIGAIARLPVLRLGESTNLAQGLQLALAQFVVTDEPAVRRVVLLTDGFTTDTTMCTALAREAADRSITISTIGLGNTFEETLLTQIADLSGGRASFVQEAGHIPTIISAELEHARQTTIHALSLHMTLPQTVTLRRITRLSPTLSVLTPLSTEHGRRLTLHLGDLRRGDAVRLLCEFLIAPGTAGSQRRLARLRLRSGQHEQHHDLIAHYDPRATNPPPALLPLITHATIAHLHRRATLARQQGNHETAAVLLHRLAAHLRSLGETELATLALQEASTSGQIPLPNLTTKMLTYATRRLGEAGD
ncbi:vWA domain-containing protein [Chloroflexus aggregans]|uniref:von Willebrand factor type A n=1 Tax=Chloroflexus aggregans (strain MD-66 / DSM 9485) TaxID=326427 RepID=B8G788_CHLAD|nr:vWA domain-containing protein [Chloroflexus aggregans]ACL24045.1 von Willebrand factor type A [Chloroflexus aggregans DSM 9485]